MFAETTSTKIVTAVILLLVIITTIGGIIILSRYEQGHPVEILHSPVQIWNGTIYIGGSVNLPGYYPFTYEDTIETLIRSAGGLTENSTPNDITLLLDNSKQELRAQKIDINRAEKWLLEALPGIGETIAQRIIDYRMNNGKFINTLGLIEVDGIGSSVYERIKVYITVSD